MKTYTLRWRQFDLGHSVVGTGLSILSLYDLLLPTTESDFLVIYGAYSTPISREQLIQEIDRG